MLSNIFNNILDYWVEWVCIGLSTLLCFSYRSLVKKIHDERETNAAMREGMKALLHNKIIEKCEKCIEKGYERGCRYGLYLQCRSRVRILPFPA